MATKTAGMSSWTRFLAYYLARVIQLAPNIHPADMARQIEADLGIDVWEPKPTTIHNVLKALADEHHIVGYYKDEGSRYKHRYRITPEGEGYLARELKPTFLGLEAQVLFLARLAARLYGVNEARQILSYANRMVTKPVIVVHPDD